ncbi:hypothetical protein CMI47_06470 [Candidatus Pacearchaeota archaeon]|nr:hypothetical protein [Candidatus Pacearchaeota archaeon]|tara:strand:+ start:191 stop:415 length:225 start_codon:yes stop_codon:yes gene_type:complete
MEKKYTALKHREFYSQKTEIRIEPRVYRGSKPYLDIREYFWNGKEMQPSRRGITIPEDEKDQFLKAITEQCKKL